MTTITRWLRGPDPESSIVVLEVRLAGVTGSSSLMGFGVADDLRGFVETHDHGRLVVFDDCERANVRDGLLNGATMGLAVTLPTDQSIAADSLLAANRVHASRHGDVIGERGRERR